MNPESGSIQVTPLCQDRLNCWLQDTLHSTDDLGEDGDFQTYLCNISKCVLNNWYRYTGMAPVRRVFHKLIAKHLHTTYIKLSTETSWNTVSVVRWTMHLIKWRNYIWTLVFTWIDSQTNSTVERIEIHAVSMFYVEGFLEYSNNSK